jgi:hypothetical protein
VGEVVAHTSAFAASKPDRLAILDGTPPLKRIALEQRVALTTVKRWRTRYRKRGLPALEKDPPRRVPDRLAAAKVQAVVEATLHSTPPGATHWSTRTMAKAQGVSQSAVIGIWHAHGVLVKNVFVEKSRACRTDIHCEPTSPRAPVRR